MLSGNELIWTKPELYLLEAARQGEPAIFQQVSHEAEREVRAAAIRAMLVREDVNPRGVDLVGATITGELDLSHLKVVSPFRLTRCSVANGMRFEDAVLKGIQFEQVTSGSIYMWAVEVQGDVHLTHCNIHGPLVFANARIRADLNLTGTQIQSNSFAIMAQRADIGGHVNLTDNFVASGEGELGSINFHWARISGMLQMRGARIHNSTGPAINAEGLRVEAVHARQGFHATGTGPRGAVVFQLAILRHLDMSGANVENSSGPAVNAEQLEVENVYMRDGFVATGLTVQGALLLRYARIRGQLSMRGAHVYNHNGIGVDVEGIDIGGSALLHQGFTVSAHSTDFAVRLLAANIKGELVLNDAKITNDHGSGILLDAIQVGRHIDLSASTFAEKEPGVSLVGSRIGSQLACAGGAVTVPQSGPVALDLRYCTLGGQLLLSNEYARTRDSVTGGLLELDGLTYRGVPVPISFSDYLNILALRTPRPAAQPYRQLASAYQALGQDALVRKIGVRQQKDAIRRDDAGRVRGFWKSIPLLPKRSVGWFIGFGWHPFRALWWMVAAFAIASVLAVAIMRPVGLIVPPTEKNSTQAGQTLCTSVDAVRLSAEIVIPLIKIGGRDRCDLNRENKAYGFVFAGGAILQTFGWAMATLFVAGFTGIVRKL